MIDTGKTSVHVITTPWTAFNADSTHPWKNYMGDFEREGLDTFYYEDRGMGWQEYTVTSAVRNFVKNPSVNYGFLVMVADSSVYLDGVGDTVAQLMTYHSAAATDSAKKYRTRLTVRYTTDITEIARVPAGDMENFKVRTVTKGGLALLSPACGTCTIMDIRGRTLDEFKIKQANLWIIKKVNCVKGIVCVLLQTEKNNFMKRVINIQ